MLFFDILFHTTSAQYKALCRCLAYADSDTGGEKMSLLDGKSKNSMLQSSVCPEGAAPALISLQDMLHALREVRPSAMREVVLEVPKVRRL